MENEVLTVATVVLAICTAVLAWATVAYARRTSEMVSELKLQARPVLTLTSDLLGGVAPMAKLTNIGRGAALEIAGHLVISIRGEDVWTYELWLELIAPGDYHQLMPLRSDEQCTRWRTRGMNTGQRWTTATAKGRDIALTARCRGSESPNTSSGPTS